MQGIDNKSHKRNLFIFSIFCKRTYSTLHNLCSILDIVIENIGTNTEYCFDSNGSDEFKCECNEGFDGKRCEDECSLECGIHGSCTTEINVITGTKQWKCLCRDNFTGDN